MPPRHFCRLALLVGALAVVCRVAADPVAIHRAEMVKGMDAGAAPAEALYQLHCAACHRPDGEGRPGVAPPLAGKPRLFEDPQRLIRAVLRGHRLPANAPAEARDERLAAVVGLDDETLARALNFAGSAWGNDGQPVTVKQVTRQRSAASL